MVFDLSSCELLGYQAVQNNTKNYSEGFYANRGSNLDRTEVMANLQNFYEHIRRELLLEGNKDVTIRTVDVTASNGKEKFLLTFSWTYYDVRFYQEFVEGSERVFH